MLFLFTNPQKELKYSISMQIRVLKSNTHSHKCQGLLYIIQVEQRNCGRVCLTAYISILQMLVLEDILGIPFWSLEGLKLLFRSVSLCDSKLNQWMEPYCIPPVPKALCSSSNYTFPMEHSR